MRSNHRPMDALRRLASRPRHVRPGPMMRMRARRPTRNRVYTLASPRVWRILESFRKKKPPGRFGAAPGESSETGGNQVLGASGACEGLPADGPELGGAARGCGVGALGPGAASPEASRSALFDSGGSRLGGPPFGVGDPEGELARAHRLGGRQAGHCSSSPGPGPCLRRPGNGGSAGRPPVMNRVQSVSPRGRRNGPTGPHGRRRPPVLPAAESRPCRAESRSHVRAPAKIGHNRPSWRAHNAAREIPSHKICPSWRAHGRVSV